MNGGTSINAPASRRSLRFLGGGTVVAVALALGVASIVVITGLQARADGSRAAQVSLAEAKTELNQIQALPWLPLLSLGGVDPDTARGQMRIAERRVRARLARLQHNHPTRQLAAAKVPLRRHIAALDRVVALASPRLDPSAAAGLAQRASATLAAVTRRLDGASATYEERASTALRQARLGSAGSILALLAAFAFFYGRSARERRVIERLAGENERLLRRTQTEALTDALTGLPNRRALANDVDRALRGLEPDDELAFILFDLDGFKEYNDAFGHPAGDALLQRLAERMTTTVQGIGGAYRMGGDEFCVVAKVSLDGADAIARLAAAALTEDGDAFHIGCSYGMAVLPVEGRSVAEALHLADQRMYEQKASGRASAGRQSADVLLEVLAERSRELKDHTRDVSRLAECTARALGLHEPEVRRIELAAELHDVGKTAIPDTILEKPGPLDDEEWLFVRRHTLIGERILRAAPSLAHTAELVRSSHERFDGQGYPDGLRGDAIPLGSRVIAVCDSYDAIVSNRPYGPALPKRKALEELRRCAGTQFDPDVVDVFVDLVTAAESSGTERTA